MKKHIYWLLIIVLFAASCGNSKKDQSAILTEKKVKLQKLKSEQQKLNDEIAKLDAEIARLDPKSAEGTAKLVTTMVLAPKDFSHYIELQGRIDADNIAYVTPRGGPGQVRAVYVKKGDFVRKGQVLLKLDDAIVRSQIAGLQSQLSYARDIYQRQQNLWKEDIGTEVQVISARNNVTALERQLATLNEQLSFTNVRAGISGVADEVNIKVGETFTGSPMQGIKIVNTSSLKMMANIPENYISRVRKGSKVEIVVPDLNNRIISSTISLVSQSIDPNTRGFIAEARIPYDANLKPNQVANMRILDYAADQAISIPINVVQSDEKGKYVFVVEKKGEQLLARKKSIYLGESYGGLVEVKSGLNAGDVLITEGYQNLYEGQILTTTL
ncbi:MAG TPA: efflux RND transporter periplasmic adaptor subunit [Chitinophagaceae bacterium]